MLYSKYNFQIETFEGPKDHPALNGVFFTPAGSVATDAYSLVEVSRVKNTDIKDFPLLPEGNKQAKQSFEPFIFPGSKAKMMLKFFDKKNNITALNYAVVTERNKTIAEFSKTDLEAVYKINSRIIKERFPEYKEIMKINGKYNRIVVNVSYLKKIVSFLEGFIDSKLKEIEIKLPEGDDKPIFFEAKREETGQTATALLMPIKQ